MALGCLFLTEKYTHSHTLGSVVLTFQEGEGEVLVQTGLGSSPHPCCLGRRRSAVGYCGLRDLVRELGLTTCIYLGTLPEATGNISNRGPLYSRALPTTSSTLASWLFRVRDNRPRIFNFPWGVSRGPFAGAAEPTSAPLPLASWLAWDPLATRSGVQLPLQTGKRRGERRCSGLLGTLPSICNLTFRKQNDAKRQNSQHGGTQPSWVRSQRALIWRLRNKTMPKCKLGSVIPN